MTIDPDRSLAALDGHAYLRKVRQDTSVTIGASSYYTAQALVGHYVTLRIDASDRTLVVEHDGQEVKRVPMKGTGRGRVPFAQFVELLCEEARTGRVPSASKPRQLALPL